MDFSIKLILVLILVILCWGISRIFAGVVVIDNNSEQTKIIRAELAQTLSQPTPWNYSFSGTPWSNAQCLNTSVDATVVIMDKQFSDVEKAIRFSLPVYVDYIRKVNSVRSLRPFLIEFPVTPNTGFFAIRFLSKNEATQHRDYVSALLFQDGIEVSYLKAQLNGPKPYRVEDLRIPSTQYPELAALYTKGVHRRSVDPKPIIRSLKSADCSAENPRSYFFDFISNWALSCNLKLILMGTTDRPKKRVSYFSFGLTGTQNILLHEAKTLVATCGRDVLHFLKTNPKLVEFFKSEVSEKNPHPNLIEYFAFRISFWDENIDRVVQPFIAEVRFVDGVFSYYTANDVQTLVLEYSETFDEAMNFLEQSTSTVK